MFGDYFLYSNCGQLRGSNPTGMQRLDSGSLILFGSTLHGQFVLDTLFVVGECIGRYEPAGFQFDVPHEFRTCTLEALAQIHPHTTLTLYRGATPANPVEGMFSFSPCLQADRECGADRKVALLHRGHDDYPRFARPVIAVRDVINAHAARSPSGANRERTAAFVASVWRNVVDQVMKQDLLLGCSFEMPLACRGDSNRDQLEIRE